MGLDEWYTVKFILLWFTLSNPDITSALELGMPIPGYSLSEFK